jgi:hypothetical protein
MPQVSLISTAPLTLRSGVQWLLAAAALLGAGAAFGADFSAGVGAGADRGHVDCVASFPCDGGSAAWKLFAGYQFSQAVDVQAVWFDAGRFKGRDTTPLGTEFGDTFKVSGFGLTGGYRWEFAQSWSLAGRAGLASARTRFDYANAAFGSASKTTVQPLLGLGLAGVCLVLASCGGSANAPPPPESVPAALTQPADPSVVEGSAATFNVTADGAAPLAYQWSSSADGVTFASSAGATNSSYNTGATTLAQSGTRYRVVVSNSLGSITSSAALLTVTPVVVAPAITVQPADQTATAPASATFNVTAGGTTLSYQWQASIDAGVTFNPVAGGPDAPSLAVTNTTWHKAGSAIACV